MCPQHPTDETFAVELTPQGRGAVAVVVVDGPNASQVVDEFFIAASKRTLADSPIGRIMVGHWGSPGGEELVVCRVAAHQVEVHCHGGVAAVNSILEALVARGCQRQSWQEWLSRREPDPIRVAAQIALANAPTARTAAILLDQFNGALSQAVERVINAATNDDWQRAGGIVDEILAFRDIGQHLTLPWRVVLAGAPNVGKSSLINALAGYERAIVDPTPGTTRDVVTTLTAIDGWAVELADTAGLRRAADEIEAAGIALAGSALSTADLIVLVRDATAAAADPSDFERIAAQVPTSKRVVHVRNKVDLIPEETAARLGAAASASDSEPNTYDAVSTSAVTGYGIDTLIRAIAKALVPDAPRSGAAVPFHSDFVEALERARTAVAKRDADEVRRALEALLPAVGSRMH